jgi:hypothetical protein
MAKTLATQRSLRYLEKSGWQCAIVEKWIPPRGNMKFGVRKDVWGFADILACFVPKAFETALGWVQTPGQIALIQTFPMARWKDHKEKLAGIPELQVWKAAGGAVYLHGWALKPKGGIRGAKKVWTLREEQL